MNYLPAVLIAAAVAFALTVKWHVPKKIHTFPEVWCADPKQLDSGPLGFCEFKLRDA